MVRHFNIEPDFDVVKIYKGEGVSSDRLINTLSGSVTSGMCANSINVVQLQDLAMCHYIFFFQEQHMKVKTKLN